MLTKTLSTQCIKMSSIDRCHRQISNRYANPIALGLSMSVGHFWKQKKRKAFLFLLPDMYGKPEKYHTLSKKA